EERSTTGCNTSDENAGASQNKPFGLVCSCQLMVAGKQQKFHPYTIFYLINQNNINKQGDA
ncbi:MAG: hypothetical protein KHW61_02465, partial [Clostridium sp.]|nr:hypothetical protein [Clostridium sp.]